MAALPTGGLVTSLIAGANTIDEEVEEEEEELGRAETYEEYMPLKCKGLYLLEMLHKLCMMMLGCK